MATNLEWTLKIKILMACFGLTSLLGCASHEPAKPAPECKKVQEIDQTGNAAGQFYEFLCPEHDR